MSDIGLSDAIDIAVRAIQMQRPKNGASAIVWLRQLQEQQGVLAVAPQEGADSLVELCEIVIRG